MPTLPQTNTALESRRLKSNGYQIGKPIVFGTKRPAPTALLAGSWRRQEGIIEPIDCVRIQRYTVYMIQVSSSTVSQQWYPPPRPHSILEPIGLHNGHVHMSATRLAQDLVVSAA